MIPFYVYAAEKAEEQAAVITYEEAVEMALAEMLILHDIDIVLRDMGLQRRFLQDELNRLTRHRSTLQMRVMDDMLWELENSIATAQAMQIQLGQFTGNTILDLQLAIAGSAFPAYTQASRP